MGSRNLEAVITDDTIAMNAFIYGFGDHSLVTPHGALQQIWWTQERIDSKVTRDFIWSRLKPKNRERLDQPLNFGDDLSSDTYMEWILQKTRRMFLILAEIGIPDQIFSVVDSSWDDDDLPLDMDTVQSLAITYEIHEQLDKKFFNTQYQFLLRELHNGSHIDYGVGESVPVEYVHRLPPAVSLQAWNRVHLPKQPNKHYVRRKFQLGVGPGKVSEDAYITDIMSAQQIHHEHIAPIYASYTWKGNGYSLTSFVGEHTLRTFIDHRSPAQYVKLPKHERYSMPLEWLHCLGSAVANLHMNGFRHTTIRPSSIAIDANNNIAFCDIGSLQTFQSDKKVDASESYTYAPPEIHDLALALLLKNNSKHSNKAPKTTSISTQGSSESSRSSSSMRSVKTSLSKRFGPLGGFDFELPKPEGHNKPRATTSQSEEEAADIFSLGCVFLEILTFLVRKKPSEFVRHRSTKIKATERKHTTRTDTSFHANLDKLDSWMQIIDDTAKEHKDPIFAAIPHLTRLVRQMLKAEPCARPNASEVRDRVFDTLISHGRMSNLHCTHHQNDVPSDATQGSKEEDIMAVKTVEDYVISPTETLVALSEKLSMTTGEKFDTPTTSNVDWAHPLQFPGTAI